MLATCSLAGSLGGTFGDAASYLALLLMLVVICCWEENEAILSYSRASDVRDVVQGCMAF